MTFRGFLFLLLGLLAFQGFLFQSLFNRNNALTAQVASLKKAVESRQEATPRPSNDPYKDVIKSLQQDVHSLSVESTRLSNVVNLIQEDIKLDIDVLKERVDNLARVAQDTQNAAQLSLESAKKAVSTVFDNVSTIKEIKASIDSKDREDRINQEIKENGIDAAIRSLYDDLDKVQRPDDKESVVQLIHKLEERAVDETPVVTYLEPEEEEEEEEEEEHPDVIDFSFVVPITEEDQVHHCLESLEELFKTAPQWLHAQKDAHGRPLAVEVVFTRRFPHDGDVPGQSMDRGQFWFGVRHSEWDGADESLSFEEAVNIGAEDARGDVLFVWSPDLMVLSTYSADFLPQVDAVLHSDNYDDYGMVGAVVLDEPEYQVLSPQFDNHDDPYGDSIDQVPYSAKVQCAGVEFVLNEETTRPMCRFEGFSFPLSHSGQFSEPVIGVSTVPFAVRRDVFMNVGGLRLGATPFLAVVDLALRMPGQNLVSSGAFQLHSEELHHSVSMDNVDEWDEFTEGWNELVSEIVMARATLPELQVMWDTYSGCTGWNIEVANFVHGLRTLVPGVHVAAGVDSNFWCRGWPAWIQGALDNAAAVQPERIDMWISHKPPPSYPTFPYTGNIVHEPRPDVVVGRSMVEASTCPDDWKMFQDRVDEIWVPTDAVRDAFVGCGFEAEKLVVIPESLDTNLFHYRTRTPPPSSMATQIDDLRENGNPFLFLAVGKFEERKGYNTLLEAYWRAFADLGREAPVALLIMATEPGGGHAGMQELMVEVAQDLEREIEDLPQVVLLNGAGDVREQDMPGLYGAVDAYVSASYGEGWGVPLMEAMAMGLPAIAGRHTGALTLGGVTGDEESTVMILVPCTEVEHFCVPDVEELGKAMVDVVDRPSAALAMGTRARRHVHEHFSNEVVAQMILARLSALSASKK